MTQLGCFRLCACSFVSCSLHKAVLLFGVISGNVLQEMAQAEADKKQRLQERKDAKEQQLKEKEEKKRKREEKKQEQLEKKQKKDEKTKLAKEKKEAKVLAENKDAASADQSPPSPNQTMPGTPKRPGALISATPRQKNFVKKRRLRAADAQSEPGASAVGDAGQGQGGDGQDAKAAKQAALHVKVLENYQLLLSQPDFAKYVAYIPKLDADKPGAKSFTAYPYEQGKSKNGIGVLFYRPAFYVRHAKISDELLEVLKKKGVNADVTYDGSDGCSLGWSRFKNVMQAYLSLYLCSTTHSSQPAFMWC